ncbi:MAG: C25 family cysteine peptidase, partial [Planctomycetota bacterium]
QGPIAVISGSRITMPYGLSQLSSELLNGCFRDRIETLGELVLQAKRRVWVDDEKNSVENGTSDASQSEVVDIRKRYRKIVTEMAQALNPSDHDLTLERREHVRLMNLLGDPLLKIPYPKPLELEIPSRATSGEVIKISGTSSQAGKLILELSMVRDRVPESVAALKAYQGTDQDHQQMDNNYQASNRLTVERLEKSIDAGAFEIELQIPPGVSGRYVVSGYGYGDQDWLVGSKKLLIRKPQ